MFEAVFFPLWSGCCCWGLFLQVLTEVAVLVNLCGGHVFIVLCACVGFVGG